MSRPGKGRLPAIGDRLARSLDGQLADIAFSIDALDLDSPPVSPAVERDAVAPATADGNDGEPATADGPAASLEGMLDEFEVAMGAMLHDRSRVLSRHPDQPEPPADESGSQDRP